MRKYLALIAALLFASGAQAAVTFKGSSITKAVDGTTDRVSLSYSAPVGSDFLIAYISFITNGTAEDLTIASMKWGTQAMTCINPARGDSGGGVFPPYGYFPPDNWSAVWICYLVAPSIGVRTATAIFNASNADEAYLQLAAFSGVAQSSPLDTSAKYEFHYGDNFNYDLKTTDTVTVNTATTAPSLRVGIRGLGTYNTHSEPMFTPGSGVIEIGDFSDTHIQNSIFNGYHISGSADNFAFGVSAPVGQGAIGGADAMLVVGFKAQ